MRTGPAYPSGPQPFTPMLVLDVPAVQVVPPASGAVVLGVASSGHRDGVVKTIRIPAGNATSLVVAADLNAIGDGNFDAAVDMELVITAVQIGAGFKFRTSTRLLPARDAVYPTVVSATVPANNPYGLVVVFSEAVYIPSLAGLSLVFTVGTARTITAITSGNGTATITLTLSGRIDGLDAFSFVVGAARTAQDLNGGLVALGSFAAVNHASYWPTFAEDLASYRGDSVTTAAGKIVTWVDKSGNGNTLTAAGVNEAAYTAVDPTHGQPTGTFAAGGDGDDWYSNAALKVAGVDPALVQGHTMIVVFKLANPAGDDILFSATDGSAVDFTGPCLFQSAGVTYYTGITANFATGALNDTNWHWIAASQNVDGTRDLYVDGTLLNHNAATAYEANALRKLFMGKGGSTAGYAFDGILAEARLIAKAFSAGDVAAYKTYVANQYPGCGF